MSENENIRLKCPACGKEFKCKAPTQPGKYSVACTNPECATKIGFTYPINSESKEPKPDKEKKLGRLEDGSYRFLCDNSSCRQSVLVPSQAVRVGVNKVKCPKCGTLHEFEIQPSEEDLLKCQSADCGCTLEKPQGGDGIYSAKCKCGLDYSIVVHEGKVTNVSMKTPEPLFPKKQSPMKLVAGGIFSKNEHVLSRGTHYVGRKDDQYNSDFAINDKYASKRSVRIDVNENGGNLVYKLTVENATNPVYHNNKELMVGDILYITYGDTLKLGKTLIKVQKTK